MVSITTITRFMLSSAGFVVMIRKPKRNTILEIPAYLASNFAAITRFECVDAREVRAFPHRFRGSLSDKVCSAGAFCYAFSFSGSFERQLYTQDGR